MVSAPTNLVRGGQTLAVHKHNVALLPLCGCAHQARGAHPNAPRVALHRVAHTKGGLLPRELIEEKTFASAIFPTHHDHSKLASQLRKECSAIIMHLIGAILLTHYKGNRHGCVVKMTSVFLHDRGYKSLHNTYTTEAQKRCVDQIRGGVLFTCRGKEVRWEDEVGDGLTRLPLDLVTVLAGLLV